MPVVGTEVLGQYYEPCATGPVAQIDLVGTDPTLIGPSLPTVGTIAAAGNFLSIPIFADGFKSISVGAKSSQAGAIVVQRYIDRLGNIPVGAPFSTTLVGAAANWLTVVDDIAFQSFTVQITNTGGSPATITNFGVLMSAK